MDNDRVSGRESGGSLNQLAAPSSVVAVYINGVGKNRSHMPGPRVELVHRLIEWQFLPPYKSRPRYKPRGRKADASMNLSTKAGVLKSIDCPERLKSQIREQLIIKPISIIRTPIHLCFCSIRLSVVTISVSKPMTVCVIIDVRGGRAVRGLLNDVSAIIILKGCCSNLFSD
jgi:hypothetical protein